MFLFINNIKISKESFKNEESDFDNNNSSYKVLFSSNPS